MSETFNLRAVERSTIEAALNASKTLAEAARRLGLTRPSLYRRIAKHGITWPKKAGGSCA